MRNRAMLFRVWCFVGVGVLCGLVLAGCSGYDFSSPATTALSAHRNIAENPHRNQVAYCMRHTCSLRQLPFIGMETTTPTVEDLLNRVIVSHAWMGERFEEIIRAMDSGVQQAVLQMSRSLVAVVIDARVRPSYYSPSSAAIYLDPLRIALTDEELSVIDQTPDFRSGFGNSLQFVGVWRYVTSGNEYFYTGAFEGRTLQDATNYLARLLFHELAHANDLYPHNTISDISCEEGSVRCGLTPWGNYAFWASRNRLSNQFGIANPTADDYHLHNRDMERYARVRYGGRSPSDAQRQVQGAEIGGWMASGGANNDYAYTTPYEDVAMLVEAVLVKRLFDADMDVGYIDKPDAGSLDNSTPVSWGQRGRIGDPTVSRRAKRIVDLMLPGFIPESERFFADLEVPRAMQTACGWKDNLDLSCSSDSVSRGTGTGAGKEGADFEQIMELDMLNPHW